MKTSSKASDAAMKKLGELTAKNEAAASVRLDGQTRDEGDRTELELWRCSKCGIVSKDKRSKDTTSQNEPLPTTGWRCTVWGCGGQRKLVPKQGADEANVNSEDASASEEIDRIADRAYEKCNRDWLNKQQIYAPIRDEFRAFARYFEKEFELHEQQAVEKARKEWEKVMPDVLVSAIYHNQGLDGNGPIENKGDLQVLIKFQQTIKKEYEARWPNAKKVKP